jgi:methionine-rich copper-binding protein CopC
MLWMVLLGLVILLSGSPAFAHAFLERASPPVGSEVPTAPSEISLTFTEGVEPLDRQALRRIRQQPTIGRGYTKVTIRHLHSDLAHDLGRYP